MSRKNLDNIGIGNRLKEVRKKLGLTLEEMKNISGYSVSTISEIERDINNPNPRYLLLLTEKFNLNLNWLFTGKGGMFIPEFELKWDFGKDSKTILKMIYLIENWEMLRYDMLRHFLKFLDTNEDKIKKYILEEDEE